MRAPRRSPGAERRSRGLGCSVRAVAVARPPAWRTHDGFIAERAFLAPAREALRGLPVGLVVAALWAAGMRVLRVCSGSRVPGPDVWGPPRGCLLGWGVCWWPAGRRSESRPVLGRRAGLAVGVLRSPSSEPASV